MLYNRVAKPQPAAPGPTTEHRAHSRELGADIRSCVAQLDSILAIQRRYRRVLLVKRPRRMQWADPSVWGATRCEEMGQPVCYRVGALKLIAYFEPDYAL